MKLGIIGGVSPFASSSFYNMLCEKYRDNTSYYPDLLIYSLRVSIKHEKEFLSNNISDETISEIKSEIEKACQIFKNNKVEIVAICCNTLSLIFSEIAKVYNFKYIMTPVKSLGNYLKKNDRCLLLATGYTIDKNLYKNFIKINSDDQMLLEKFIEEKINNKALTININDLIKKYDYDIIALGCTDINKDDICTDKVVIDSNECLLNDILNLMGDTKCAE